jgi:nucleoside-diphosphate-sugar epimerase
MQQSNGKTVLLTGGGGFVGRTVAQHLRHGGFALRYVTHRASEWTRHLHDTFSMAELDDSERRRAALSGVDTIVHCAGRTASDAPTEEARKQDFEQSNCATTEKLALHAIAHGVRRFIFISSMNVIAEGGAKGLLSESTPERPVSHYGASKLAAEQALKRLSNQIEIVTIRPPLVYGPGVSGNFRRMMAIVQRGLPLPLGGIKNRRHFIGTDNLADVIRTSIDHPGARNATFVVSDERAASTPELLHMIADAMGKRIWLIPVPHTLLHRSLRLAGLSKLAEQLFYDIEVDSSNARRRLGWHPPFLMQDQVRKMVDAYLIETRRPMIDAHEAPAGTFH